MQTSFKNLNGYIRQMCMFSDYERCEIGNGTAVCPQGIEIDFETIRCAEVMLKFMDSIISHNKGKGYIRIRFFAGANGNNKEICVIPVRTGDEQMLCRYIADKFGTEKNEVVIFLLDSKEQMKLINVSCNCRFAVVTDRGAVLFRK